MAPQHSNHDRMPAALAMTILLKIKYVGSVKDHDNLSSMASVQLIFLAGDNTSPITSHKHAAIMTQVMAATVPLEPVKYAWKYLFNGSCLFQT